MNITKNKLIAGATVIIALALIVLASVLHSVKGTSSGKAVSTAPTPTLPSSKPPADAVAVAARFATAREDSVGADQTSPASWVQSAQALLTPAFLAELNQSNTAGSAGNGGGEYNLAHNYGFTVTAKISDCIWDFKVAMPTDDSGVLFCALSDSTVKQGTGKVLFGSALPFGWTHSGNQQPLILHVQKVGGAWLVSDDSSMDDPD